MWPGTDPIAVSTEPHLGQVLVGLRPSDADSALAWRVTLLERQLAVLESRLAVLEQRLDAFAALESRLVVLEIDHARPWWGARAWHACVAWLSSLKERI